MLGNLSLRNMTHLLFRRRATFLAVALVPPALCAAIVMTQQSQYDSEASVMVKVGDEEFVTPDQLAEQQGRGASAGAMLAKQIISGAMVIMTSGDVHKTALTRVGVSRVYPKAKEKAIKAKVPELEMALEMLEKDLTVKINGETTVLDLTLANTDPDVAQQTLAAVLQASVEKQAAMTRDPRTEFLDRKLETLRAENTEARRKLLEFKQRTQITAFDEERTLLLRQRDEIQQQLSSVRAELVSAQGRSSVLQGSLSKTPEQIALSDENDRAQRTLDQAQARVSTARTRYESAQRRFTAGNPELADAKSDLDAAERELASASGASMARVRKGINPLAQSLSTNLSNARSDANASRAAQLERERQLDDMNKRLAFLDSSELELRELEQRVTLTDASYHSYQRRAESAQILRDMNEAGISNLSVMQAPTRPYRPARPKKALMMALSIVAGLLAAFGICVLRETLDETVSFPEQLEDVLGLPVLASFRLKKTKLDEPLS
ncbi:MAG: lipopolysaccharide biosynthesis [Myxococcaceae bacterium]|nr:lipopolysaccharide biosynthesis [Myxococcaceae bacterium]